MAKGKVDHRAARYSFILKPYSDFRLSKCPQCERPTHSRKFPLVIHVENWRPVVLGKTCRYCTRCELIMAHQDELEAELAVIAGRLAPEVVGNDYLVLGTMDKKVWQEGLQGKAPLLAVLRKLMVDFKRYLNLKVERGWGPKAPCDPHGTARHGIHGPHSIPRSDRRQRHRHGDGAMPAD